MFGKEGEVSGEGGQGAGASLPVLDHEMDLLDCSFDLFEVFPAAFVRLKIQGAAEGENVPEVANATGLRFGVFAFLDNAFASERQLVFDSGGVGIDGFAERFSEKIEFLSNRFRR